MSKIKIGFSNLDVPKQVERSRKIQTAMLGNPDFPDPSPKLDVLKKATDLLETAYNESRGRDKNKIQIMKLRRAEMLGLIVQLSAYVQSTSAGNKEIILSSGFDVIQRGTPQPPVGQVLNLRLSSGSISGSIKALWDRVPGAKIYAIEISNDPFTDASFKLTASSSKTRCQLEGLNPGTKYWVRIAAVGKDGTGKWSDPAAKIAE